MVSRNSSLFRNRVFLAFLGSLLFHAVLLGSLGLIRSSSPDSAASGIPSLVVSLARDTKPEPTADIAVNQPVPEVPEERPEDAPAGAVSGVNPEETSHIPVEAVSETAADEVFKDSEVPGEPIEKSTPVNNERLSHSPVISGGGTDHEAVSEEPSGEGEIRTDTSFEALSRGLNLPAPSYPPPARKWGYQGEVLVSLTINEAGELDYVVILESSGYDILDKEVIRTIKKKWHFNPPGETVVLEKLFEFRLE